MAILGTTGEVSWRYRVRDKFCEAHSRIGMLQTGTINKGNFTFDLGTFTHVNSRGLILVVLQLLAPSEHGRKADLSIANPLYCDQAATRDCDCGESQVIIIIKQVHSFHDATLTKVMLVSNVDRCYPTSRAGLLLRARRITIYLSKEYARG